MADPVPIRRPRGRGPRTTAEYTAALPERVVQDAAIAAAQAGGWQWAHFHDSRRQVSDGRFVGDSHAAGFPDFVAVRGSRLVVMEFKRVGKQPTPKQADWLAAFTGLQCPCGRWAAEVYVPTPQEVDMVLGVLR